MAEHDGMKAHLSRFLARHRWSFPLGALATLTFVRLALEVRAGELYDFDAAVARFVMSGRGRYDALMFSLTELGDWHIMLPLVLLCIAWLMVRKRRHDAFFVLFSAGGAALLNTLLKLVFHRARPDPSLVYFFEQPHSFSFPSGHAMGSLGVLATFLILLKVLGVPRGLRIAINVAVGVLLVGVATSRVYFGVHYPSDVLGGQLAGAAWVSLMTGWFYPRLLPGESTTREVQAAAPS